MRNTVNILGVNIDNMSAAETLDKAYHLMNTNGASMIFTPNPEIIMRAVEDASFRNILNSADICTADGIGVYMAAKLLRTPVPERVAGYDLVCALLEKCCINRDGIFLFGSKPGIAEDAQKKLNEKYNGINIVGTNDGFFSDEETPSIVDKINASGAKLLLVCLGAPKQEKWIFDNRDKLAVNLCMGVGGALDVFAGEVKRAPDIFIKLNLEWFYRLAKQPSRIGRYMALPKFIFKVLTEKITQAE